MVKHVDEVELRVVVAAVLPAAPEAVLVAQHLLNRGAHTAYPCIINKPIFFVSAI